MYSGLQINACLESFAKRVTHVTNLDHVGPNFFVDLRLLLGDLEYPRGEGVVVDPPARPQGGRHYRRVRHQILVDELLAK